jgi:hypothetical protein
MPRPDQAGARHTPLCSKRVAHSFFARFFIRNRLQSPEAATECTDVQQIVAEGHRLFPNFSARNPWIFSDSIRGRAWIFLDPDTSTGSVNNS